MPDIADAIATTPHVQWSLAVLDLGDGRTMLVEHDSDRVLRTASIGKLILLVETAERIAAGRLDPREPLTREPQDAVADSGLWQHLRTDTLCVADVATLIGSVSDNLATNVLLRRIGLDSVHRRGDELGLRDTVLHDKVRDARDETMPPTLSTGTARELAGLMADLAGRHDLTAATVRRWIANSTDLSMVGGAFGLDPLAHQGVDRGFLLHHKTGANVDVRADVGVVVGPQGRLAYAVLANWSRTDAPGTRDGVLAAMRSIGAWMRVRIE